MLRFRHFAFTVSVRFVFYIKTMRCVETKNLLKAIRQTVALTKVRSAVVARRCNSRWAENLRSMTLQQAQREMRLILRGLSIRVIGRAYDFGAFNNSLTAIRIAAAVIMERGNIAMIHTRALMRRFEEIRHENAEAPNDNDIIADQDVDVVNNEAMDAIEEAVVEMDVDQPVQRPIPRAIIDYDAIEEYNEEDNVNPIVEAQPRDIVVDREDVYSVDSGLGSSIDGGVIVVHAMVHQADEVPEQPELVEQNPVRWNAPDSTASTEPNDEDSSASTEVNEELGMSDHPIDSRKLYTI